MGITKGLVKVGQNSWTIGISTHTHMHGGLQEESICLFIVDKYSLHDLSYIQ